MGMRNRLDKIQEQLNPKREQKVHVFIWPQWKMYSEEFLKTKDIPEGDKVVLIGDLRNFPMTEEEKYYKGSFPPREYKDAKSLPRATVEQPAKAKPLKKRKKVTAKIQRPDTLKRQ